MTTQDAITSAAATLGRKGGQAKNPYKGFGSNLEAQRKAQEARKKGRAMRAEARKGELK